MQIMHNYARRGRLQAAALKRCLFHGSWLRAQ